MKKVRIRLLPLAAFLLVPSYAYAYIDPGSGLLLYQGLVAAIGVALTFVRHPWKAVKRVVTFLGSKLRR